MPIITCIACGAQLDISINAPSELTCPRCLAHFINSSPISPTATPSPVIPLEQQVLRDISNSRIVIFGLILACAGGVGVAFYNYFGMRWVLLGVITFTGAAGGVAWILTRWDDEAFEAQRSNTRARSNVLEYGLAKRDHRSPGSIAAITFGSVLAGMLVTGGVFVLVCLGICGGWFR